MQNNFFGSKLNTILLLVLVILVLFVIYIMFQNKETYLGVFEKENIENKIEEQKQSEDGILGNKEDLISFSISPFSKVSGNVSYNGIIKGAYFFEANILINILDENKKVLKNSHANATTDWMISGPVSFEGNINFTGLKKGPAYFEIKQDDASGGESGKPEKFVLIPIIIE